MATTAPTWPAASPAVETASSHSTATTSPATISALSGQAIPAHEVASPVPQQARQLPKADRKRIQCLVLDTGPLIKNETGLSTIIASAEELYTIPSVLSEIKDEATRSRVQTQLLPFLKIRSPRPESVRFITDFSRRTGDLEVLSKPDIHLLALCFELQVEKGGELQLRKDPTQRGLNGKPSANEEPTASEENESKGAKVTVPEETAPIAEEALATKTQENSAEEKSGGTLPSKLQELSLAEPPAVETQTGATDKTDQDVDDSDSEDGNWITPSNLKKHQAKDGILPVSSKLIQETLLTGIMTSDFAMQNVALRINLNLVSPSNMSRITQLKTWVLRCYGCFTVTRAMEKQFCPKCGQATLTRTSCSTDAFGNTRLHLKKNFQYNKRGNVYSVPKPVHGSASGKLSNVRGGGKKGWGRDLILAEDQKEYVKKADEDRRARYKDLMDEDYLPSILTGDRTGGHGRIRVGAGRNVNARKRG